ncbi:MAG: hypothetical protein ACRDJH_21580 [Thermomicrobiales bacterium]
MTGEGFVRFTRRRAAIIGLWLGSLALTGSLVGILPWLGVIGSGAPIGCIAAYGTGEAFLGQTTDDPASPESLPSVTSPAGWAGTPVAQSNGVALLYYDFVRDPSLDDAVFLRAELLNTNPFPVRIPQLTVTLLDDAGKTIEVLTPIALPGFRLIPAGELLPMFNYVPTNARSFTRTEVSITGGERATDLDQVCTAEGVELRNVTEVERGEQSLTIRGEIVNGSSGPAWTLVYAVIYNADGQYVTYGSWRTDYDHGGEPIAQGTTVPIEIAIPEIVRDPGPDWTYRVTLGAFLD